MAEGLIVVWAVAMTAGYAECMMVAMMQQKVIANLQAPKIDANAAKVANIADKVVMDSAALDAAAAKLDPGRRGGAPS